MKKLLLGVVIGAFGLSAWNHFHPVAATADAAATAEAPEEAMSGTQEPEAAEAPRETPAFHCDGRVYCSQMTSCEEARYFLENCPGVKMDGEGDGVPCEGQWCGHH